MGTIKRHRDHPRLDVRWPVLYGDDELLGQGTLLDVSGVGARVVGTMPVAAGKRLKLWVFPPQEGDELYVEETRVLWVNGQEFAIDLCHLLSQDHQGLKDSSERAEHGEVSGGRGGQLRPTASWRHCHSLCP